MARFRSQKQELSRLCAEKDWKQTLEERIATEEAAREAVDALLALLPRPDACWQAAFGLGLSLSRIAAKDMEAARVFMRRLMWGMNEESGNLGWGIPEAMGCILANSPALAKEYARILLSYGHDTGREDNFVEHAPLRRGVYWGVARLAAANPAAALPALASLTTALDDEDAGVRGMAAFALRVLADSLSAADETKGLWRAAHEALSRAAAHADAGAEITLLEGEKIVTRSLADLLADALTAASKRLQ